MNNEMDMALKPCPFCGGEAYSGTITYSKSPYEDEYADQLVYHHVNCAQCLASVRSVGGYPTEERAIAAWNTRADTSLQSQLTAAKEALEVARAFVEAVAKAESNEFRAASDRHAFDAGLLAIFSREAAATLSTINGGGK